MLVDGSNKYWQEEKQPNLPPRHTNTCFSENRYFAQKDAEDAAIQAHKLYEAQREIHIYRNILASRDY